MHWNGLWDRHWDAAVLNHGVVAQVMDGLHCARSAVLVAAVLLLVFRPEVLPVVKAAVAVIDWLGWQRHRFVNDLSGNWNWNMDDVCLGSHGVEVLLNDVPGLSLDQVLDVRYMNFVVGTSMCLNPETMWIVVAKVAIDPSIVRICHAHPSPIVIIVSVVLPIPGIVRKVHINPSSIMIIVSVASAHP